MTQVVEYLLTSTSLSSNPSTTKEEEEEEEIIDSRMSVYTKTIVGISVYSYP
jgi:hypothetical protein